MARGVLSKKVAERLGELRMELRNWGRRRKNKGGRGGRERERERERKQTSKSPPKAP